jgi:hypothetical protein
LERLLQEIKKSFNMVYNHFTLKSKMAAGQEEVRLCCSLLSTHSVSCGEGGRAFYPTFSFMSHSCVYNARHVIAGDYTMRVYAQKRIQQGDPTIHKDREHFPQ